jgi:hypothetical protein
MRLFFLVETDIEGGYIAQALGESIFSQADDLETLKIEIKDAVISHSEQDARTTSYRST